MLQKFLNIAIYIPIAVILIALVVANRGYVPFTFDPFNPGNPALTFQVPLFALLFIAIVVGMMVGSVATWIRQAPYRKIARQRNADGSPPASGQTTVARPRA